MNSDELKMRTKQFAHRCVKLALALPKTTLGNHLSKQLIRSATSVAANYRAACIAQSKASFSSKLSIAFEEMDASYFWIEFIHDENLIEESRILALLDEADQLTKIFAASRKTSTKKS